MIKNRKEQLQQHDKSMWVSKTLCKPTFFWAASFFFFSSCFFFFLSSIKWFSSRIFASFHSLNKKRWREMDKVLPQEPVKEEYFGSAEWTQMKVISWHFLFSWMVHFISLQTEISVSVAAFVTRDDMWTSNTLKSLSAEVNSFDYRQPQNPNSINICSGSSRTTPNQSGLTATHSTQNDPLPKF